MLRPERMSKVSVTGSRAVLESVIETMYDVNLVHLSDYDGSWAGFDNGDPMGGADAASEKLVTVRALESTLGVDPADVDPASSLEAGWEDRLEAVRTTVNDVDDERTAVRDELRQVDDRRERIEPFAELGIDLDLLSGYDSVEVVVGEGPHQDIGEALDAAEGETIRAYETFTGGDVIAIVAAPADGVESGAIDDALVGVEFSRHEVPDVDKPPAEYVTELERDRRELEAELSELDQKLARVRDEHATFLRGVEVALTMDVQQAEAPLRFATTERAFVAEGWIPTGQVDDVERALRDAVGDRIEFEELEVADYEDHGHHEAHDGDDGDRETQAEPAQVEREEAKAATDGGRKSGSSAVTDGGSAKGASGAGGTAAGSGGAVTMDEEPPVVLDNLTPAKPFEVMVKMVNQPKYSELDPTLLIFLTYPFAFGFMIGDIGYGILYMLMGYGCWKLFDSDAGKAIGTIGIWAGVFTIIFGYLYDDIFGIHMSDVGLGFLPGAGVLSKGLQLGEWALLWIILSILFGIVHLNVGLVMGFVNELSHGLKTAVYERLSWILAMNGLFLWIFSTHALAHKPDFLVGAGGPDRDPSILYETDSFALGFEGLPEIVGIVGLVMVLVGAVMIAIGEGVAGVFEIPAWAFGHVLSYLRMVAVLLAKGGMAFAVNLLAFGAYDTPEGYTYFNYPGLGIEQISGYEYAELEPGFVGLVHAGDGILVSAIAILGAILVFVFGHILVLLLGITAAGIQMLRLEYVEFFQKFYEGGGEEYEPFGAERATAGD